MQDIYYHNRMEENSPPAQQNKPAKLAFLEIGLFEVFFVTIVLFLLFGILNYFNVLSVSDVFPKQLGWLPRLTHKINVSSTSSLISICKPFPQNYGKTNCQKAVEVALSDTKGEIKKITVGILQINPAVEKNLKIPKNQKAWIISNKLAKSITSKKGEVFNSLLMQIPLDGKVEIYRTPINL